jgi:activator of 2-hydroxyglutaryl-CoA dehydratase
VGIEPELTFTGGVSRNVAMVQLIGDLLGMPVNVSEESHYCGAIGAALFALDHVLGGVPAGLAQPAGVSAGPAGGEGA